MSCLNRFFKNQYSMKHDIPLNIKMRVGDKDMYECFGCEIQSRSRLTRSFFSLTYAQFSNIIWVNPTCNKIWGKRDFLIYWISYSLMELDDGRRWNVVGNTYNGNAWHTYLYSPDDALIVLNIYRDLLSVYLWNVTKYSRYKSHRLLEHDCLEPKIIPILIN